MITKVVHGWSVADLITYLMGPGRAQEHRQPRVIASWDGRDAGWQPSRTGPGEWEFDLGPLSRALRAPAVGAGLSEQRPAEGGRGFVWHCSVRVAGADRVLSDAEWAGIARELLHGAGVAERDDPGGPRWVAIRHADDHIHVGVVLVRQDSARRFWPFQDYPRLRETAREIERRLGLTLTAAADGTAARGSTRGELEKAARTGRAPARVELLRAVQEAAVAASDVDSFVTALRGAGYLVGVRYAPSGDPLGYKVARPGDVTAAGEPVFYSGSKLASDVSLPRLMRRWAGLGAAPDDLGGRGAGLFDAGRRRLDDARRSITGGGEEVEDLVGAAGEVVTALGARSRRHADLGGGLVEAAAVFDRAVRAPRGAAGARSRAGGGLRWLARALLRHPRLRSSDEVASGVALLVALTALLQEISVWQRARGRVHQAAAAERAARGVDAALPASWWVPAPTPHLDRQVAGVQLRDEHGSPTDRHRRAASGGGVSRGPRT